MKPAGLEKTLVLVKPDALKRGIAGELISRFEKAGLKMVGMKMVSADEKLAEEHYPVTDDWYLKVGNNTLSDCKKYAINAKETMGTDDPMVIGKMVGKWNMDFLMSGPVVAIIFEGNHAIENVRNIVGSTIPTLAAPGTIRGDYSLESAISANSRKRAVYNLIHASGTPDEAEREIKLWFTPKEMHNYQRIEEILYG
ncbi:MAG TPA: nucleoside-diphosphate kinase [Patescibacteria group bacterium]